MDRSDLGAALGTKFGLQTVIGVVVTQGSRKNSLCVHSKDCESERSHNKKCEQVKDVTKTHHKNVAIWMPDRQVFLDSIGRPKYRGSVDT